jgi:hypothetical protein
MSGIYDTVQNPIPTSGLFATPANQKDLLLRIQQFPGPERALAFQMVMMTFNLCHKMVEEEILSKDVFCG